MESEESDGEILSHLSGEEKIPGVHNLEICISLAFSVNKIIKLYQTNASNYPDTSRKKMI